MISSYKKLTGRYLKANKKRTVLTLIGIILSVALVSSIGLFIKGMQASEIEQTKNAHGSFHLMFTRVNEDLISKVANNPKVARYGLYKEGEETAFKDNLTLSEIATTEGASRLIPYVIKSGRMPQNERETAVEEWVLRYLNKGAKVGDKISFANKEYYLSGILENTILNQYNGKVVYLTKTNSIPAEGSKLLVELSLKTNLRAAVDELKQLSEARNVEENGPLLMRLGAGDDSSTNSIYLIVGIIIAIVVVATIAVIYNSFQISVVERIREFGLLRAVGASPRQIRRIVLKEATILALIGVPVGLLFGVIAITGITAAFKLIGRDSVVFVNLVIDPFVMLLSLVIGLLSIYISALLPSIFAGKISPLAAISSRTSITKEKIKKSNHRIIHKFLGFEGAMAAKNIKRNRKRYRITVFSITISVVLFVAFKSFMDMTFTISNSPNESRDIHFTAYRTGDRQDSENIDNNLVNSLKAIKSIDKVYRRYVSADFEAAVPSSSEVKEVQEIGGIYSKVTLNGSERTLLQAGAEVYDEAALEKAKKYVEAGSIDIQKLNQENGVILINKNLIYNGRTKKKYVGPVANLKVGDEIELQHLDFSNGDMPEFGKGKVIKVKVMAILSEEPFDFYGAGSGLKLITTEDAFKNIVGEDKLVLDKLYMKLKDVKDEETAEESIKDVMASAPSINLINNIDSSRRTKSTLLMVQILIYGFVIVVSLISCVNIINTLTTNIILRKREFAALKSIGLTQRGLRKMIVLEGLLYGIVGSIYGAIVGCGLSYLMYKGFGGLREFSWPVPWNAMVIASAAALVIGYISVLSPLSRIKKENLIEAIREE